MFRKQCLNLKIVDTVETDTETDTHKNNNYPNIILNELQKQQDRLQNWDM